MAFKTLGAVGLCFAAVCLQLIQCENWALLVAGSNGYDNYRHQADICHAYHIVRSHGIPQENIVTMMYNDIAYNERNPVRGNIINQPDGPNLYPGVVIDYQKQDVTPNVFQAVLVGNAALVKRLTGHEGKVINSGPDDHVFVYFADHGAPGLLAFPDDTLHARDLISTLRNMFFLNSMKKLVMYVEACESGSMFYNLLPGNINVYATTAANPTQPSYACYYDSRRKTYLGDVYSVNWMEDSDTSNLATETLQQQYQTTKRKTTTSEVMQYGDLSISAMTVAAFQGNAIADVSDMRNLSRRNPSDDAVPTREAKFHILKKEMSEANTPEETADAAQKIKELMEHNAQVDKLFQDIVAEAAARNWTENVVDVDTNQTYWVLRNERDNITQWECYEHAVDALMYSCPKMKLTQDYHAMGQLFVLVNMCERRRPGYSVASAVKTASLFNPQLCARIDTCVGISSAPQLTVGWVLYALVVVYFVM